MTTLDRVAVPDTGSENGVRACRGGRQAAARAPRHSSAPAPVAVAGRHVGLDVLRGLAVLLMVTDHLAMLLGDWGVVWRLSVGRFALPLFFIVAGHLAHRFGWRHVGIAVLGLVLPLLAPWVDAPNVLVLYAAGTLVLVGAARVGVPPLVVVAVALTVAANGWALSPSSGYEFAAVVGLMALGAVLPRSVFDVPAVLAPGWVASIGRRPLRWYVGHVLVVTWLGIVSGVLV